MSSRITILPRQIRVHVYTLSQSDDGQKSYIGAHMRQSFVVCQSTRLWQVVADAVRHWCRQHSVELTLDRVVDCNGDTFRATTDEILWGAMEFGPICIRMSAGSSRRVLYLVFSSKVDEPEGRSRLPTKIKLEKDRGEKDSSRNRSTKNHNLTDRLSSPPPQTKQLNTPPVTPEKTLPVSYDILQPGDFLIQFIDEALIEQDTTEFDSIRIPEIPDPGDFTSCSRVVRRPSFSHSSSPAVIGKNIFEHQVAPGASPETPSRRSRPSRSEKKRTRSEFEPEDEPQSSTLQKSPTRILFPTTELRKDKRTREVRWARGDLQNHSVKGLEVKATVSEKEEYAKGGTGAELLQSPTKQTIAAQPEHSEGHLDSNPPDLLLTNSILLPSYSSPHLRAHAPQADASATPTRKRKRQDIDDIDDTTSFLPSLLLPKDHPQQPETLVTGRDKTKQERAYQVQLNHNLRQADEEARKQAAECEQLRARSPVLITPRKKKKKKRKVRSGQDASPTKKGRRVGNEHDRG